MRLLALTAAFVCLTGCGVVPETVTNPDGSWTVYTRGSSMYLPNRVTLKADWDSVQRGDVCAYSWGDKVLLHRVYGRIGSGWIMKGDFNLDWDEGVMTKGNYIGTMTSPEN